jgi:DNA-binding response OmpR family regulator
MELFRKHSDDISLVILDVIMPKMSGLAVFERIREKRPELCVLFSSGYSIDAVHGGVVFNERTQMIQKPYHPGDLLRKVRQVLDGKL